MKVKIDTDIKPIYIYIILGVAVFIFLSVLQFKRNSNLNQKLKDSQENVEVLESTNEELKVNNEQLIKKGDSIIKEIDNVTEERTYYKNKYYVTNKKLKDIINNYNSLSAEDRWDEFTKSLNN